jgi:hypothetical protein
VKQLNWLAGLTAVTVSLLVGVSPAPGQGGGGKAGKGAKQAPKAGPVKRLRDGKPDMQGFWETRNFFTAFDLETHDKATFEVPAGKGVVVDPPDGKIPYQAWALAKKQELVNSHLADDPQAHCFLSGVPRQIYTPFGFQIMQPQGHIALLFEAFHAYRVIHMDGRPHPDQNIRLFEGDSRGHWDGDTLVVDTTNLNDRTWYDTVGDFHSDVEHVVERFTPVDTNTIKYEATVDDSKTLTKLFKIAMDLYKNNDPKYEQMEFACIEGNEDVTHYTKDKGGNADIKLK